MARKFPYISFYLLLCPFLLLETGCDKGLRAQNPTVSGSETADDDVTDNETDNVTDNVTDNETPEVKFVRCLDLRARVHHQNLWVIPQDSVSMAPGDPITFRKECGGSDKVSVTVLEGPFVLHQNTYSLQYRMDEKTADTLANGETVKVVLKFGDYPYTFFLKGGPHGVSAPYDDEGS